MTETNTFKNRVVVITGGAHGIGKTTKEAFEAEGAIVEVIDIAEGEHGWRYEGGLL